MKQANAPLVLVTGANGQLGRALSATKGFENFRMVGLTHQQLDITNERQVAHILCHYRPDFIINSAAYTDVVGAEVESEKSFEINAYGPEIIAKQAEILDAIMIQISTDFVFSGNGPHDEAAKPAPLNVYGHSKLAGEHSAMTHCSNALIIRTAWIFDECSNNFVTKLSNQSLKTQISVVSDEVGSPTSAHDLAAGLSALVQSVRTKGLPNVRVMHLVNRGYASRHQMAQAVFDNLQARGRIVPVLVPVSSVSLNPSIQRPSDSRLDGQSFIDFTGHIPRHWMEALGEVMDKIAEAGARGAV